MASSGESSGGDDEPHFEVEPELAPMEVNSVPEVGESLTDWAAFASCATLEGVGCPWYMSPSRWCGFALQHQSPSALQQDLRWCEVDVPGGLVVHKGEAGSMDTVETRQVSDYAYVVQGTAPAPQFREGSYFEVVVRKIWPQNMVGTDVERPSGPVGIGLGFTTMPPSVREEVGFAGRARNQPRSWVVGYEGRAFCNGEEIINIRDDAPPSNYQDFNKDRMGNWEGFPIGPLGWSMGDLGRGDRVGLLAEESGHLSIYVNKKLHNRIAMEAINGHMPLYPLLEVCGVAREVGLDPQPHGPWDEDKRAEEFCEQAHLVESLGPRAVTPYADLYASAIIAQECFLSTTQPAVPPAFMRLLLSTAVWFEQGRPTVLDNNNMVIALSEWCRTNRICDGIQPNIGEVCRRVFETGSGGKHDTSDSGPIRTVHDFRMELNRQTSCSHISPEFLRSHEKVMQETERMTSSRKSMNNMIVANMATLVAPGCRRGAVWDLKQYTLSSSHVRRVVMVLQSEDGKSIGSVSLSSMEPNVPLELKLQLAKCFWSGKKLECADGSDELSTLPRLILGDVQLPAEECPLTFSQLREANTMSLMLHFVDSADLSVESPGEPAGPQGAATLAESLLGNQRLKDLRAGGQAFGDEGAELIGEVLQQGSQLLFLSLRSNRIGEVGARCLADALLQPNCHLQKLDLAGNDLGSSGCRNLAAMLHQNETLLALGLQRNNIGGDGAISLADALINNHTLEELDLGRNAVGAAGAAALVRATRANCVLAELNLQDNELEVCAAIQMADEMRAQTPMSTVGKRRSMSDHAFGKPAGAWTDAMSALKSLNLRHNKVGSKGGAALIAAALTNKRLTSLNLAWNCLGLETATVVADLICGTLTTGCGLEELDLRDNNLGEYGALGFAFQRGSSCVTVAEESPGSASCPVNRQSKANARRKDSEMGTRSHISTRCRVQSVSAQSTSKVRWLNLANCKLDLQQVGQLATVLPLLTELEVLLLYNNPGIGTTIRTVATFAAGGGSGNASSLEPPVRLEVTTAASPEVAAATPQALFDFGQAISPKLRQLSLGSCALGDTLASEFLNGVARRSALQELDLSDNNLAGDAPIGYTNTLCESLCAFLKASPTMQRLRLGLNNLGDNAALEVAKTLAFDVRGVALDISANKVSKEFWTALNNLERPPSQPMSPTVSSAAAEGHSSGLTERFVMEQLANAPNRLAGRIAGGEHISGAGGKASAATGAPTVGAPVVPMKQRTYTL